MILEMCIESVESAVAAARGGADRVELCANLLEGGTTPSLGCVRETRKRAEVALAVMVRPRGGDFCYTEEEFAVMREDVRILREEGADGIVLGILQADGQVDVDRTAELVGLAAPLPVTFHRAFDVARDPREALETLCAIGVRRILTSGQEESVLEGLDLIAELVRQAGERVIIMPGCGVTLKNCRRIAEETGAREIHVAANSPQPSLMDHRNPRVFMGTALRSEEYTRYVAGEREVKAFAERLKS